MTPGNRSTILAGIVAEVVERRRRGEHPSVEEYQRLHPELAEEIEGQLRMIEILEGDEDLPPRGSPPRRAYSRAPEPGRSDSLGEVLAIQPPSIQRLIFLRNFEKRSWKEIAEALGRPERELRLSYSRALRELMDWFGSRGKAGS